MTDLTAPVESRRNDLLGSYFARFDVLNSKTNNEMRAREVIIAARDALVQMYQEQQDLETSTRALEAMGCNLLLNERGIR